MNTNNLKQVLYRGWMNKAALILLLLLTTGIVFATVQTNCIYFTGVNQSYVDLNKNLVAGDFTLEAWIYPVRAAADPTQLPVLGGKLASNNLSFGYDFVYGMNQKIVFRNSTSTGTISTTSNASVPLNQWTHVAVTWGTGGTSPNGIYINGVFDQAINVINDLPTTPGPMYLGMDYSASSWWKGRMDEFRYWTCKREQADIAANMNLSIRTPQPNLLISLPFTEGSGYNSRNYASPMNPGHFVMLGDSMEWVGSPTAPTVTTQAATLVSETTATLNGTFSDIGSDYPWLGFVWNTTGNPTFTSPAVDPYHYWGPENTTGPFSYNLTGLTSGQTYYVRAFGANNGGFAYGTEISFTTTSSGYNVNISTGNISGVSIYSNLANYGIDPVMPIVLAHLSQEKS